MKSLIAILVASAPTFAGPIFGEIGAPKSVHCRYSVMKAKEPITQKTDLDKLYEEATHEGLGEYQYDCDNYGGCAAVNDKAPLNTYYSFNTQNGQIVIEDADTGVSATSMWTQQYGVTKAGYLTATLWLTNTNGGLMGDNRAFQIEVSCQAYGKDWP